MSGALPQLPQYASMARFPLKEDGLLYITLLLLYFLLYNNIKEFEMGRSYSTRW